MLVFALKKTLCINPPGWKCTSIHPDEWALQTGTGKNQKGWTIFPVWFWSLEKFWQLLLRKARRMICLILSLNPVIPTFGHGHNWQDQKFIKPACSLPDAKSLLAVYYAQIQKLETVWSIAACRNSWSNHPAVEWICGPFFWQLFSLYTLARPWIKQSERWK